MDEGQAISSPLTADEQAKVNLQVIGDIHRLVGGLEIHDERQAQLVTALQLPEWTKAAEDRVRNERITPALTLQTLLLNACELAYHINPQAMQAEIARQLRAPSDTRRRLGNEVLSLPFMFVPDQTVAPRADGSLAFSYWGNPVVVKKPPNGAARVRDVLAGRVVLLENKNGDPLTFVSLCTESSGQASDVKGNPITLEELSPCHLYGPPVTLDAIQRTLNDLPAHNHLEQLMNRPLNPSAIPLFARVRLHDHLWNEQLYTTIVKDAIVQHGVHIFPLYQLFEEKDLKELLTMIHHLDRTKTKSGYSRAMLEVLGSLARGMPAINSVRFTEQKNPVSSLFVTKIRRQLLESADIIDGYLNHKTEFTAEDLDMILFTFHAMDVIAETGELVRTGLPGSVQISG